MAKRRLATLLPAVNQTEVLTKFFGATVDQLFQPGTSEQISAYVGQYPSYYDPGKDFYLDEPTDERQVYQLEASMVSFDDSGNLANALTYPDMLAYLNTSGGNTTNEDRLFNTDFYTWAPPIDIDKLLNYHQYYWFGDDTGSEDLPTLVIASPVLAYTGDGTTISFAMPSSVPNVSPSQETPAAYVNGTKVVSSVVGDTLQLASPPASGSAVVTTRHDDLAAAIRNQATFPLTGMLSTVVTYFGDDYSTTFPISTLNEGLTANAQEVIAFVNGERVNYSFDAATGTATLIGVVPSSGTKDITPDLVEIVVLNGIYALSNFADQALTAGAVSTAVPYLSSSMRVRLLDTQSVYSSFDLNLFDEQPFDTPHKDIYFVDGVGQSIRLTSDDAMVRGFTGQYVTIDRSSINGNAWSVRNNWVHQDTYAWSTKTFPTRKAIRPIVEFVRDISIYNYGLSRTDPVEACLSTLSAHLTDTSPISVSNIAGRVIGTVTVDQNVTLVEGMRLLVAQGATDTPSMNQVIFTVGVNVVNGQNLITLTPTTNIDRAVTLIAAPSNYGDTGTEAQFIGGTWTPTQQWNESVDPLFELYDVEPTAVALDDSSRYPGSTFTGSRIFGYAVGTGSNDTVLLRPLQYDNNGYIVFECDVVTRRSTFNGGDITGLYCFATDNGTSGLAVSPLWYQAQGLTSQTYTAGNFKSVPTNLQANPMSEDVTTISRSDWTDHFAQLLENQVGFSGSIYAGNSYRDSQRDPSLGTQILQHRAPMLRAMLLASNTTFDYGIAVRYADQEYTRFRNKFVKKLVDLRNTGTVLDSDTTQTWVTIALTQLKRDKSINFPFSLSGMGGDRYFIPPTPAYIGLLPPVTPAMVTDSTYTQPVAMLRGHDGSTTPAFNDWRDPIVLLLEQMIYNSINTNFKGETRLEFDLASWFNGRFYSGSSGFTFNEVQQMLAPMFERWATINQIDYRTNTGYDQGNPFTWNFRGVLDLAGNSLPGHWRGIYRFYYDTDRPHVAPWEMLGFVEQPAWWTTQYGNDFSSNNTPLWTDLEAGTIRQGERAGVDPRYARPGLSLVIPVNATGALLDPVTAHILSAQVIYQVASRPWALGDGAPAEAIWRNSPSYRFALAQLAFLMKPNRVAELLWDTLNTGYIGEQWVDLRTLQRPSPANDYLVHGEIDETTGLQVEVIGIQQWLVDTLFYGGQAPSVLGIATRNLNVRLLHRMAAFVSAEDMRAQADNFGLLPTEDLSVMLYQSPDLRNDVYSGVIVERSQGGYRVVGYDARDPYFNVIPPNVAGPKGVISLADSVEPPIPTWRPNTYYTINIAVEYQNAIYTCLKSHTSGTTFELAYWNQSGAAPAMLPRVTTYRLGLTNLIEHVPYGTEFPSVQAVADFLLGYERYLVSRGWVFDDTDSTTNLTRDWTLAVREFLGWSQVQWSKGNFIALSPGAEKLRYVTATGNVLNVEDASNGFFGLIDRSGQPIASRSARIARLDGNVTFSAIDADIFGCRVRVVDVEHALVFSNTTIFNDIMYAPLFNLRQARMRLIGYRTREWAGRLDAPGFIVLDAALLPNFEKNVEDIRLMFEIEKTDRADLRDFARHQIAYQARDYMENLLLSETEQFEFYQGQIQAKGSPGVFDRLLRSQRINGDSNIVFLEEWAIRESRFGAPVEPRATLLLPQSSIRRDPQIIRFVNTPGVPDNWISMPADSPLWLDPPKQSAFFPVTTTPVMKLPTAGYVRVTDVQYTSFTPADLSSYFIAANTAGQTPFLSGERIWIYNVYGDQWSVWRIFDLGSQPNTVNRVTTQLEDPTLGNTMRLFFDFPIAMLATDVGCMVVIDGTTQSTPDLIGMQTVLTFDNTANSVVVSVPGDVGFDFSTTTSARPVVRIMRSVRFRTSTSYSQSGYPFVNGDMIFIDDDNISTPGRWTVGQMSNDLMQIIREQPDRVDPNVITESMVYANGAQIIDDELVANQPLINDLVVVDPLLGELPGQATRELDFILDYDPADYNTGPAPTGPDVWGIQQVGRVWWDTSTVRYLDPYTDTIGLSAARDISELEYRAQYWAQIAPNTSVDIYEWVQSDVAPGDYTTLAAADTSGTYTGTVYQAASPSWATRTVFDPTKSQDVTAYFFWVSGRDTIPAVPFRNASIATVAQGLTSPSALGVPWVAPIAPDTLLVSGVQPFLNETTSALKIEKHTDRLDHGHDQWLLLRANDEAALPPNWLWRKMRDSLSGFDDSLTVLPYASLHPTRATGIYAGQSMFLVANTLSARGGLLDARQSFVGIVNDILTRTPVVTQRLAGVTSLDLSESLSRTLTRVSTTSDIELPDASLYDIEVYTARERNKLMGSPRFQAAITNNTPINVLINNTRSKTPEWSIWTFNPAKAANILTLYAEVAANETDRLILYADRIFDLATAYDYAVPHVTDRNALLSADYYAQNILINGVITSYSTDYTPTARYTTAIARDNTEGATPSDRLVEIDDPVTSSWTWTVYDNTYGWIEVAHSKPILTGTRVYVESDETADGFWSVYRYDPSNPAADPVGFVLIRQQDYRTIDFFQGTTSAASPLPVVDWYAQSVTINSEVVSFTADKPPMVTYATTAARDAAEGTSPNNLFVQIKDATTGAWFWTAFDATNGWQTVALQGGTIALSAAFYDPTRIVHGVGAPAANTVTNRDGSWEMRILFDAIVYGTILTDAELNEMLFSMVHFIHAQQDDIDWIFKTSFMSVAGYAEPLLQTALQTNDVTDSLIAYITEVKPYHVKLRDYSQQYSAGTDTANIHVTDFDKPVYLDPVTKIYRTLDPNDPIDLVILQGSKPWSEWYAAYQSPISPVRRLKVTVLFDRVANDADDAFDAPAFETNGFDGRDEDATGTAAGRIAASYSSIDPITGKDINAILTYSYGAVDLLNTRFKGRQADGGMLATLSDPGSEFDAAPGGFDTTGFDVQVLVQSPQTRWDGGTLANNTAGTLINAPTSDENRAVSDTRTILLPDGSSFTAPLGGVADPKGYGLRDPYAEADRPEERVPLLADDGVVMTVVAGPVAGAPPQRTKVYDTSNLTVGIETFPFDEIAESIDAVMVWRDGVRATANTDYTLNYLGRTVSVNLIANGARTNKVVVHAFGFGGTSAIRERHLLAGSGATYTLDATATLDQIEVVVNGVRLDSSTLTVSNTSLTLPSPLAASDDLVIVVYSDGTDTAVRVQREVLNYNTQQSWYINSPDKQSIPQHAATIVEIDGIRLLPPLTFYGQITQAQRGFATDYSPDNNTLLEVWVDGEIYHDPIPFIMPGNSGYPFGAVAKTNSTITANANGMLAFLDNALVSLDPSFTADTVVVVMHINSEFDVNNDGLLTISKTGLSTANTIVVTTFSNAGEMAAQTRTFRAKAHAQYDMPDPLTPDYAWITFNGKLLAPQDDYGFGAGQVPQTTPRVIGRGPDTVEIAIAEDFYLGNALFSVSIDGVLQGGNVVDGVLIGGGELATVGENTGGYTPYQFKGFFGRAQHTVVVTFLNDASGTGDRNLRIDSIRYNDILVPNSNGTIYCDAITTYPGCPSFLTFTIPAMIEELGEQWIVATLFTGCPARDQIGWRAATKTPAALRMVPIEDDGGFESNPFELQGFGRANEWLLAVPNYHPAYDIYGNVQGVPIYTMQDRWEYAANIRSIAGTLNHDIYPTSATIALTLSESYQNAKLWLEDPLPIPDPAANKPGVVWIGGERIEYWGLTRTAEIVVLDTLKRGTRGTTVCAENRTVARVTTDGTTTDYYLNAYGGTMEVRLNGVVMGLYNAALAASVPQGYTITSTNSTGTVISFHTAPPAGQFLTLAMTVGYIQRAGSVVVDATHLFEPLFEAGCCETRLYENDKMAGDPPVPIIYPPEPPPIPPPTTQPVIVPPPPANQPPVWVTPAGQIASVPMLSTASGVFVKATDPDGDTLRYTLVGGMLPSGLTLNTDGTITGTPNTVVQDTSSAFTITASDGKGGAVTRGFAILVTYVDLSPVWITPGGSLASEPMGTPISPLSLQASDPRNLPLTYRLVTGALPSGLTLTLDGTITGTPPNVTSDVSSSFTVSASDGQYATPRGFSITVQHVNRVPVWVTGTGSIGTVNMQTAAQNLAVVATDADGDTLTYSLTSGAVPPGLTFNADGTITGTTTSVSADTVSNFTAMVSDGKGGTAVRAFAITVHHVNRAPYWVTPTGSIGTFTAGTASNVQPQANDPDGDTLTYALASGTLPPGMTLDVNTGIISGTPAQPPSS